MKINKVEDRNGLQRIYAEDWIIELPKFVNIGKKLNVVMLKEDTVSKQHSVLLNGHVFRSFAKHCLVSCGGLLLKVPHALDVDSSFHLGIEIK